MCGFSSASPTTQQSLESVLRHPGDNRTQIRELGQTLIDGGILDELISEKLEAFNSRYDQLNHQVGTFLSLCISVHVLFPGNLFRFFFCQLCSHMYKKSFPETSLLMHGSFICATCNWMSGNIMRNLIYFSVKIPKMETQIM